MARLTKPRTAGSERTLAKRVRYERQQKTWTYEALAREMKRVGCDIDKSSLHKIEVADSKTGKYRSVKVDELIGFSNVFDLDIEELLKPFALIRDARARSLVERWAESRDELGAAQDAMDLWWTALTQHIGEHPESEAAVKAALSEYARRLNYPDVNAAVTDWTERAKRHAAAARTDS